MKTLYKIVFIFLLNMVLISCTNGEQINNESLLEVDNLDSEYSLISPNGLKIATDKNNLLRRLNIIEDGKYANLNFIIENIEYLEGDDYSFSIVNCYLNSEFYSILMLNKLQENKIVLQDKHSLRIVDKGDIDNTKSNVLVFKDKEQVSLNYRSTASCRGGDCCTWETIVQGEEYNCGCPSDPTTSSIIMTTSDGCQIHM